MKTKTSRIALLPIILLLCGCPGPGPEPVVVKNKYIQNDNVPEENIDYKNAICQYLDSAAERGIVFNTDLVTSIAPNIDFTGCPFAISQDYQFITCLDTIQTSEIEADDAVFVINNRPHYNVNVYYGGLKQYGLSYEIDYDEYENKLRLTGKIVNTYYNSEEWTADIYTTTKEVSVNEGPDNLPDTLTIDIDRAKGCYMIVAKGVGMIEVNAFGYQLLRSNEPF